MPAKRKKATATRTKAATSDIVGSQHPEQAPPAKWKKHFADLVSLRDHLLARQNGLVDNAKEEQSAFSLHMADAATDSFDRDFALSRASSEQDAVYEIDEALNRIRDGSYGICELTGQPIEPSRLAAIPWTRFSLEAEAQLEKNGTVRRARLAPREPVTRGSGRESESSGSTEEQSADQD